VLDVEADELEATERTGKADHEQRAIGQRGQWPRPT
jgi:hypothetical protein